jgi:hypothetical protein
MRNDSPDRRIDLIYRLLFHEIKLSHDPNSLGSVCEDIVDINDRSPCGYKIIDPLQRLILFLMSLNKLERVSLKFCSSMSL